MSGILLEIPSQLTWGSQQEFEDAMLFGSWNVGDTWATLQFWGLQSHTQQCWSNHVVLGIKSLAWTLIFVSLFFSWGRAGCWWRWKDVGSYHLGGILVKKGSSVRFCSSCVSFLRVTVFLGEADNMGHAESCVSFLVSWETGQLVEVSEKGKGLMRLVLVDSRRYGLGCRDFCWKARWIIKGQFCLFENDWEQKCPWRTGGQLMFLPSSLDQRIKEINSYVLTS